MFYNYKGKNQNGISSSGLVEANSDKDAIAILRRQGLYVLDIRKSSGKNYFNGADFFNKVSFSDIVNFTRQFSTMISSGLTLTAALSILKDQTKNKIFRMTLEDILQEIQAGRSLSSALEKYPQYFTRIYLATIKAGEAGGLLDKVLGRLADNLEKEKEFKGKIKGAMVYPTIILFGMIGVVFIMMTMVVPKLTILYKEFNANLPFATKFLIASSDFFVNFWWLIILVTIGLVWLFRMQAKTAVGKKFLDTLTLSLPVWGKIKKATILSEMTRTLGLLIGTGLPIIDALNIVADSLENINFREGVLNAAHQVEKGFPLGVPFSQNDNFPVIVGQMIKVGEETGKLDETLLKVSSYFEAESEELLKGLTMAIEPIIMIIMGIGVAFLIWAIIMPIYQLTESF